MAVPFAGLSSLNATSKPRIALAHDWLVGMRGGEWVLDRLAQQFGPAELYTLVHNGRPHTPAIDACTIITSPLQKLPGGAGRLRRHYLPLYRWAVERLRVNPCDLLISTSSAVMKSIIPPKGAMHICYCHSPARYIWEQSSDYALGSGGGLRAIGLKLISRRFQNWDRNACERVHSFLANSHHTAARIERCYGRKATVVYPPCRTNLFTIDQNVQREGWLLVVGALEPYKRADLVVQAANRAGWKLKIAGDGSQRKRLQAVAGPTVEFLGHAHESQLLDLYRRASALIFPQVEDFGITAVEAQAAGCPVIAFNRGGAAEIVQQDTGTLFHAQTVDCLIAAVEEVRHRNIDSQACRNNAERFSEQAFDSAMKRSVSEALAAKHQS